MQWGGGSGGAVAVAANSVVPQVIGRKGQLRALLLIAEPLGPTELRQHHTYKQRPSFK